MAVRRCLSDLPSDAPVAVAVSGGADSLALAAALAHLRPGAAALVVDHALQAGSAQVAARAAEQCRALGLTAQVLPTATSARSSRSSQVADPVNSAKILAGEGGGAGVGGGAAPGGVGDGAGPGGGGPEAAARAVRYAALDTAAERDGLVAVLLGHTLDDQAETVLLGLARGSGARSLAGMAAVRGRYRRPLLATPRATVRLACRQAGLTAWEDPHNADPAYARVRVRALLLPALEQQLGPGIAGNLARTAGRLREDADALDAMTPLTDDVAQLAALPAALCSRALKRWAELQCGTSVSAAQVDALRALVQNWHGQGPVALPGGVLVRREAGRLACPG